MLGGQSTDSKMFQTKVNHNTTKVMDTLFIRRILYLLLGGEEWRMEWRKDN